MALERVKDELFRCITCSECVGRGPNLPFRDAQESTPYWICPILEKYGFMTYSPRGLQFIANKIHYQGFPITEDLIKPVYSCVTCNLCGTQCTRPFMDIFRALREEMTKSGVGPPDPVKKINERINKTHNFMGAKEDSRTRWAEGLDLPKRGDTFYFAGCYGSFRQPQTSQATVKVLRAAGIDVAYLGEDEWCCGMIPGWSGEPRIEVEMAEHNVQALKKAGAKRVVIACAEGYRTFSKEYPRILGKLPFQVVHTSQFAAELLDKGKLRFDKQIKEKVTYHDPCFLGRHCRVYAEPRKAIEAIKGITFTEMQNYSTFAHCCGNGAGITGPSFPEMEQQNASKIVHEAMSVADTIITACPRCVETLNRHTRKSNMKIETVDLMDFLSKAL